MSDCFVFFDLTPTHCPSKEGNCQEIIFDLLGLNSRFSLYFPSVLSLAWKNSFFSCNMSTVHSEPLSTNSIANNVWNPTPSSFSYFIWLEWSQMRIRSGEPFDYIFPLDYFYLHNTAHWQNCSPLLYFRPLIFWFLVGLARQAWPKLRSIWSLPPKDKN